MRNREGGGVDQAESAEERAELGVILGYELLLPPERLSDAEIDAQTLADIGVVRRCIAGRPDSVTVRLARKIRGGCDFRYRHKSLRVVQV